MNEKYKASKFVIPSEEFVFGDENEYKDGLLKKINGLYRSIEEECLTNDGGKWKDEFEYVLYKSAREISTDPGLPQRIRDQGHNGMRLADFMAHPHSVEANLSEAEVAVCTSNVYRSLLRTVEHSFTILQTGSNFVGELGHLHFGSLFSHL